IPQMADRRSGALAPANRMSARPWVRSVLLTYSSDALAVRSARTAATSAAWPGGPISSHSPGPEPTTRTPDALLPVLPNGTPTSPATWPVTGALSWILVSGVQSVSVSAAVARRPLTSQPSRTVSGSGGRIGLRASGPAGRLLASGSD